MLKQLLTACAVGSIALSAMAAESQVVFTYANDEAGYWGKSKAEIYDVAMRIDAPALAGKKIVSIRAVLNASEGIDASSVWLSKELNLEKIGSKKYNMPDVYADSVAVEKIQIEGFEGEYGQLSSTLKTPYEITSDGIYVGYTINVTAPEAGQSLTTEQKNPLLLSPSSNPESLYLHTSRSILKWTPYNNTLGAAAMIYVTLEGEFPEYSVGVKNLSETYADLDKEFYVKAELSNIGTSDVTSIDYTYTLNGGKVKDAHLDLADALTPDFTSTYTVMLPIEAIDELGQYEINLTVTKVNGNDNVNAAATATTTVITLPYVPTHRPLVEEFTGTWCGWCTRGYLAMELLAEEFGDDVVLAAYHDGDAMAVTNNYPVYVEGLPSSTINRNGIVDPYYGNGKGDVDFSIKYEVEESMNTVVPADIKVQAVWANEEQTEINVTTSTRFFEDKENTGYKVGYLLINNGLTDPSWSQSNYYAGSEDYAGTHLEVLTTWPSSVRDLIFNDVVVDVNGMKGVANSIPENIEFNVENTTEFSYDIASNKVIQDKTKLIVAAFIINPNGTILNAAKSAVSDNVGVGSIENDATEVSAEYFNLSGMRVAAPAAGMYIKVAKMSDGTTRTSKVVVR